MRPKFLGAVVALMMAVVFPALSSGNEHEEKFAAFWKSIESATNPISWGGECDLQDVEFVKDEMFGDETVYERAWYSDYYVLIRRYKNKDWSSSFISNFWTNSEELTFANGIKVGAPFSKVESYFGDAHLLHNGEIHRVFQYEESDGGGALMFSAEDGIITSIGCYLLDNQTSKMDFLYSLYSGLYIGEVTGEKVNVREYAPNGKIKFQVSRSKGDFLLVEDDNNGWYRVAARITNGKLKTVPDYSISSQFLNVRKITPSERRLFISQYRK